MQQQQTTETLLTTVLDDTLIAPNLVNPQEMHYEDCRYFAPPKCFPMGGIGSHPYYGLTSHPDLPGLQFLGDPPPLPQFGIAEGYQVLGYGPGPSRSGPQSFPPTGPLGSLTGPQGSETTDLKQNPSLFHSSHQSGMPPGSYNPYFPGQECGPNSQQDPGYQRSPSLLGGYYARPENCDPNGTSTGPSAAKVGSKTPHLNTDSSDDDGCNSHHSSYSDRSFKMSQPGKLYSDSEVSSTSSQVQSEKPRTHHCPSAAMSQFSPPSQHPSQEGFSTLPSVEASHEALQAFPSPPYLLPLQPTGPFADLNRYMMAIPPVQPQLDLHHRTQFSTHSTAETYTAHPSNGPQTRFVSTQPSGPQETQAKSIFFEDKHPQMFPSIPPMMPHPSQLPFIQPFQNMLSLSRLTEHDQSLPRPTPYFALGGPRNLLRPPPMNLLFNDSLPIFLNAAAAPNRLPAHRPVRLTQPKHPLAPPGTPVYFKYGDEHYPEETVPPEYTFTETDGTVCRYITNFLLYNKRGERLLPIEVLDQPRHATLVLYGSLLPTASVTSNTTSSSSMGQKQTQMTDFNESSSSNGSSSQKSMEKPGRKRPASTALQTSSKRQTNGIAQTYPVRIELAEWCIDYGQKPTNVPFMWLISRWDIYYRLEKPAGRYISTFATAKMKFEVSTRIIKTLQQDPTISYRTLVDLLTAATRAEKAQRKHEKETQPEAEAGGPNFSYSSALVASSDLKFAAVKKEASGERNASDLKAQSKLQPSCESLTSLTDRASFILKQPLSSEDTFEGHGPPDPGTNDTSDAVHPKLEDSSLSLSESKASIEPTTLTKLTQKKKNRNWRMQSLATPQGTGVVIEDEYGRPQAYTPWGAPYAVDGFRESMLFGLADFLDSQLRNFLEGVEGGAMGYVNRQNYPSVSNLLYCPFMQTLRKRAAYRLEILQMLETQRRALEVAKNVADKSASCFSGQNLSSFASNEARLMSLKQQVYSPAMVQVPPEAYMIECTGTFPLVAPMYPVCSTVPPETDFKYAPGDNGRSQPAPLGSDAPQSVAPPALQQSALCKVPPDGQTAGMSHVNLGSTENLYDNGPASEQIPQHLGPNFFNQEKVCPEPNKPYLYPGLFGLSAPNSETAPLGNGQKANLSSRGSTSIAPLDDVATLEYNIAQLRQLLKEFDSEGEESVLDQRQAKELENYERLMAFQPLSNSSSSIQRSVGQNDDPGQRPPDATSMPPMPDQTPMKASQETLHDKLEPSAEQQPGNESFKQYFSQPPATLLPSSYYQTAAAFMASNNKAHPCVRASDTPGGDATLLTGVPEMFSINAYSQSCPVDYHPSWLSAPLSSSDPNAPSLYDLAPPKDSSDAQQAENQTEGAREDSLHLPCSTYVSALNTTYHQYDSGSDSSKASKNEESKFGPSEVLPGAPLLVAQNPCCGIENDPLYRCQIQTTTG